MLHAAYSRVTARLGGLDRLLEARSVVWWPSVALLLVPIAILLYDGFLQTEILDGEPPVVSGWSVVRTLMVAAGSVLLVRWVSRAAPVSAPVRGVGEASYLAGSVAGAGAAGFLLFAVSPSAFNQLGLEDRAVEVTSAALALAAAAVLAAALLRLRGSDLPHRWFYLAFTGGLAAVLFLLGMEEISWGQRYLGFGTPEAFEANIQAETNFHNFATDKFEALYYTGASIFLIFLPFIHDRTRAFAALPPVAFFIPSRAVLLGSSVIAAYSYDKWNLVITQFEFFVAVSILAFYLLPRGEGKGESRPSPPAPLLLALLAVCFATQAGFLVLGHLQVRDWDVTEYKELLIPLAFLAYAVEVLRRSRRLRSEEAPA